VELGYDIGHGFDAYTTSSVLKGSGLSSSAAFEVMVANIISSLYNNGSIEPVVMAQAAQFAEREFFGKPCGLMDQTACAVGGFVAIDFANPEKPVVKKLEFDFEKTGYTLCIVDTAGNHSNLNEDYASIQFEMKSVAKFLGKEVLNDCDESMFYKQIPEIREAVGDRAVLRAIHFFGENARVSKQVEALRSGNFERFKELIIESGRSSNMYLQNIFSVTTPKNQELSLALAVAELILAGNGAWRVHGGGFSGTIQAFVPSLKRNEFVAKMNSIFGEDATYTLLVRPVGAYTIK
jgi:galactokinase